MKDSVSWFRSFWHAGPCVLAAVVMVSQAQAQSTLSNYNSTANLNLASSQGMYNWTVAGVDQLSRQWFWYRVGNSAEASIDTISAPSIIQTIPRMLTVAYSNQSYAVRIEYTLTGNRTPGSGNSGITESITIANLTSSPLDFHFFEYTDVNLGNTTGGQTVKIFSGPGSTQISQTQNGTFFDSSVSPYAASHFQAGNDGSILASLTDGSPTTLSDVASISGGDANWALQWDFTIAGNDTRLLSQLLTVPEPSALSLLILAAAGVWLRRRH